MEINLRNGYQKKWLRKTNPVWHKNEKMYRREYYQKHKEEIKADSREHYHNDPLFRKKRSIYLKWYRKTHRDKINEKQRLYRIK